LGFYPFRGPDASLALLLRIALDELFSATVEAAVRAPEKRRQQGDIGVTAQRYSLVLFGNNQRLELFSWQPETKRTVSAPFEWKPDTWYHLKLRGRELRRW
jgi:hypothetical protein